ncbi:hypothetical protein ACFVFI_08615 [Streptomyces sp. NPDC057705]|uniref:hypothetical protein n=1 Tax=Streptomyces sp. NPDC057705 TaxID=3346222 RepID=UPI00368ECFAC
MPSLVAAEETSSTHDPYGPRLDRGRQVGPRPAGRSQRRGSLVTLSATVEPNSRRARRSTTP